MEFSNGLGLGLNNLEESKKLLCREIGGLKKNKRKSKIIKLIVSK